MGVNYVSLLWVTIMCQCYLWNMIAFLIVSWTGGLNEPNKFTYLNYFSQLETIARKSHDSCITVFFKCLCAHQHILVKALTSESLSTKLCHVQYITVQISVHPMDMQ